MTTVLIFFLSGMLLVAVEVVVPGAVLGILGGLCLLAGTIAAFLEFGPAGGAVACAVAFLIGAVTLYLEFVLLPKTRLARMFSMTDTVSGTSQPPVAEPAAVLGGEGVALTVLAPSGYVELAGRRYEAFCRSGHVNVGARVRVVEVDNFRIIVTQIKESS